MRYLIVIILLIFFAPLPSYCKDYSGIRIQAIEVEGVKTVKPDEVISLMGIQLGQPYSPEAIRAGIKRTFIKGVFEDIAVDAEEFNGGVKLKYIVEEKVFIKGISFSGNHSISSKNLRDRITVKERDEYRKERLKNIEDEIKALYSRIGFKKAEVRTGIEEAAPSRVKIVIDINEGYGTKIKAIEIKGEPVFDKGEILLIIGLDEGSIIDTILLSRADRRIKEFYINNGYLNPDITQPEIEYIGEEVLIKIQIKAGPLVSIEFEGNASIDAEKLRKAIPLSEGGDLSDEMFQDSAERIVELYRKEGYYFCRTSVDTRWSNDKKNMDIKFFISEGEKLRIETIKFEGNKAISSDKLKTLMTLKERGIFKSGYFEDSILNRDIEAIEALYRGLGYLLAKAKGEITFNESKTEGYINISISEGIQCRVERIEIEGNKAFSNEEIFNILSLKKGMTYNDFDLGEDRYRVLALYSKKGYIYAEVEAKRTFSEDYSQAFINLKIDEDRPATVGKIIIRGNQDTKDKIIKRELLVKNGDIYNQEDVFKSIQRVYRLGLFSQVRFEPIEPHRRIDVKDMLLTVKERNAGAVEFGLGYGDYDKVRGFLEVSYKNLGGYNRQISLRGEGGSITKKYALGFKEPWFLNNPIDFTASIIREEKKSINIETGETRYETKRTAGIVGIEKSITDKLKGSFLYQYERVDTFNIKEGAILTREDTGTLGISSLNPSLIFDTRDDPFNPGSGILTGILLKYATKYLGSEVEFYKVTVQGSWYLRLWKGTVLALSGKGGLGKSRGDTEEIPLIERFFLGGRTTVRGYSQDMLGPKGSDGTPTGGNTFALLNGELRFSLPKDFGLVTFIDAGNVWISPNLAKVTGLKYTVGLGIRYETPVGPLRLDYGHKMNREPGESRGELHFAIGHAF